MKKKHKIIYASDTCYVPVRIYTKQDGKWYEYILQIGDKITISFTDSENSEIRYAQTVTVDSEITDEYVIKLNPDMLRPGKYLFDARIDTIDGDSHLIVDDSIVQVKED